MSKKKKKKNQFHPNINRKGTLRIPGNSLAVQRLGLCTLTAEGPGLIPGRGTKIPQATQHGQKKKVMIPENKIKQT